MKAILTFRRFRRRITLIVKGDDIQASIDGAKWKSLAWEFDQYLRSEYKYADNDAAGLIRDRMHEIAHDMNLTIE